MNTEDETQKAIDGIDEIIFIKEQKQEIENKLFLMADEKLQIDCACKEYEKQISILKENCQKSTVQYFSISEEPDKRMLGELEQKRKEYIKQKQNLEMEEDTCQKQLIYLSNILIMLQKYIDKKDTIKKVEKISQGCSNGLLDLIEYEKKTKELSEKDKRLNLGLKILQTQESERKRIARELHDTTVQNLTNLVHKTELCSRILDIDKIRTKLELQTMISTIHETIDDMRAIIYDLRPMSIDDLGLVPTVERFVKQLKLESNKTDLLFRTVGDEPILNSVLKLTVFRIIQEGCHNALKHAEASQIKIFISFKEKLYLDIMDNGKGFNTTLLEEKKEDERKSIGLSIMKERIFLLAGEIQIESSKKSGTKIHVKIPLIMDETKNLNNR